MRYMLAATAFLLTNAIDALTITSPSAGETVDPSQPITIRWNSAPADPSTIDLVLDVPASSVWTVNTFATNVETASGSYTIPANTLAEYGNGFSFAAQSPSGGTELANTGSLLLANGVFSVVTGTNGQTSLEATSSLSSIIFDTSGVSGQSVTATYLPSTDLSTTVAPGVTSQPSTVVVTSTTSSHTGSTGSTSGSGSSSTSTSSSAASATSNAAFAQADGARTGMGLMGVLAGAMAILL